jgi:hypothetical protein
LNSISEYNREEDKGKSNTGERIIYLAAERLQDIARVISEFVDFSA